LVRLFFVVLLGFLAATASAVATTPSPCKARVFEGDRFTVCAFKKHDDLRIVTTAKDGTPLRSFTALATELGDKTPPVHFAMNAGMFDDDGHAIGLLVENYQTVHAISTTDGPGNFHMKPNGVFFEDLFGGVHVETADKFIEKHEDVKWATQSGPMLVINGKLHPKIARDGPSHYIRNGVGVVDKAHAYFVISETPVSFGKLARLFRDKLKCKNALYFDGSVSSLWVPATGRMDVGRPLGPMVVVLTPSVTISP
jgi:uncharacterized protein YigE (DUF2233 family)